MIFQQVLDDVVRQAVTLGVLLDAAIRPALKESARGRDPQKPTAVFEQVIDENLFWMSTSRSHVHRQKFETIVESLQTVEMFHGSAPDRSAAVFIQHIDGARLVVFCRNHDCEHGRRS
jgi:hypothetical protein